MYGDKPKKLPETKSIDREFDNELKDKLRNAYVDDHDKVHDFAEGLCENGIPAYSDSEEIAIVIGKAARMRGSQLPKEFREIVPDNLENIAYQYLGRLAMENGH